LVAFTILENEDDEPVFGVEWSNYEEVEGEGEEMDG